MELRWLGRVPYLDALKAQRDHRESVIAGEAPGVLWLLEHPAVITTGRREAGVDVAAVGEAGFELVSTERGGLATCHEPGQLVGYLLVDVSARGIRRVVCALEQGLIDWLAGVGVPAGRREGFPGVWANGEKVAAIGLHVKRGVTMHGFALNLVNDLRGFGLITPCGIPGARVTTVERLSGRRFAPADAALPVGASVRRAILALDTGAPRE